jgi:signal transduction histidine kinase
MLMLSGHLEQKNIKLNYNNVEDEFLAKVDSTIFKNVIITNIISNAIKFSEENATIDIRVTKKSGNIRVEVQDYGIGIPPEIVPNLFSFKAKTTRIGTKGESGTGYGMPLVKEFMDKMGGRILVESSEIKTDSSDRGTIMILEFPAAL